MHKIKPRQRPLPPPLGWWQSPIDTSLVAESPMARGKAKASPKAAPPGAAVAEDAAPAPPPCQGHNTMLLGHIREMANAVLNHPAFEAVQNLPPHALGAGGSQEPRIQRCV